MKCLPILMLSLLCFLGSCSSWDKDQCLTADWASVGERDARAGLAESTFDGHEKSCWEHAVRANRELYKQGHQQGLKSYCTYPNGLRLGEQGHQGSNICPAELQADFYRGISAGRDVYEQKKYLEERRAQEKRMEQEQSLFHRKVLANSRRRSCHFDTDCEIRDHCSINQCAQTTLACTFDADCSLSGSCIERVCVY